MFNNVAERATFDIVGFFSDSFVRSFREFMSDGFSSATGTPCHFSEGIFRFDVESMTFVCSDQQSSLSDDCCHLVAFLSSNAAQRCQLTRQVSVAALSARTMIERCSKQSTLLRSTQQAFLVANIQVTAGVRFLCGARSLTFSPPSQCDSGGSRSLGCLCGRLLALVALRMVGKKIDFSTENLWKFPEF